MNPRPLDPGILATLDALLVGFRKDDAPRFPDREALAAFAHRLELVLTGSDLVADYLGHLDTALGSTTPEGELSDENEIGRFSAEGLGWMTADRLAKLAIGRGAVMALHEMVFDVWSDYWWERNVEREKNAGTWVAPSERLDSLKARLTPPSSSSEPSSGQTIRAAAPGLVPSFPVFAAFGHGSSTTKNALDRTILVPNDQVVWITGDSVQLTVTLSLIEGQLTVRTSPLPLLRTVQCGGWLADSERTLVRGTIEQTAMVFTLPSGFDPRYFVADYHSAKIQAVYAVALDEKPVGAEMVTKLVAAIAANLQREDPARAALLIDATSRTG